jgi:hypothetical protein
MKKIIFIGIILITISCSNEDKKENTENKSNLLTDSILIETGCCLPDSSLFYYSKLPQTFSLKDISLLSKMNSLDSNQVNAWLKPVIKDIEIPLDYEKSGYLIKMLSFQRKTKEYSLVLIAFGFDEVQQFLITINPKGQFVDGLEVSYLKNLSNSDVEYDKTRALYKYSTKVLSTFGNDTIKLFSIEDVGKIKEPHENKDVWQELYETRYLIKSTGTFQLVSERKQIDSSKIEHILGKQE